MKIVCDYARCTSNGLCEDTAPEYFEILDNGDLQILNEHVEAADLDAIEQAVKGCPTQALDLVE